MSKFTVAGVSRNKGQIKVRFCSDLVLRVKNLQKQGDTDIQLVELPCPMTKVEACHYLINCDTFSPFVADIVEAQGKKAKKAQPVVTDVKVEVDPEIEELKQLVEA